MKARKIMKLIYKIIIFIICINNTFLNARFLDLSIFVDKDQEATELQTKSYIGPITLDLAIALCQQSSSIITSASLLANIDKIRKSSSTGKVYTAVKNLILNDSEWDIYKHRSGLFYLLIPKTYLNNLMAYNTPEFQAETKNHTSYLTEEILTGFRINPATSIFKKMSWNKLELEPEKYNATYLTQWKTYDTKINKNVDWLEIFTKGQDDIFGLWNISLDGHGSYPTTIFSNPGYMPKTAVENSDHFVIAGINLEGYRNFIQFLTGEINTNFLHYTTCFGGDLALFLPYITTLQNYKGNIKALVKKPNFTIAAGALTSELVYVNSSASLLNCKSPKKKPGLVSYKHFFEDLKKFAPNATKAIIYNDKELREILLNVTDRVKTSTDPYGISGLPSVMFPNSEIFRSIPLDKKTAVITDVFLKKHTLAFQKNKFVYQANPIKLKDKEVILIYPSVIPVEIEVNATQYKPAPAIVSMALGMSLTKINSITTNIPFYKFLNESIGATNPVFNKYFFIDQLTVLNDETTKNLFGYKAGKTITLKNVLALIKNEKGKRRYSAIFMTQDNSVYKISFPNKMPVKLNLEIISTGADNFFNSMLTYFEQTSPEINEVKNIFDWKYLSKIMVKTDKEIFDKRDKTKKEKLAKDKAAKDAAEKAAKDKLTKLKALKALKEKQFKNVSDILAKQAPILQQFKNAQVNKNIKQKNKLKPQVQKIRTALNKTPVNIQNYQGQTHLMVNPRIAPIVYGLNKQRAKITANAKDKKGKTVLQYLIASPYANNINLYKALIAAGAKVTNNDIKAVQNKLKGKPALKPIVKILKIGQMKNK